MVNTVVDSVKKSFISLGVGGDKGAASNSKEEDSSPKKLFSTSILQQASPSANSTNSSETEEDKEEKGEQTMVLDAAADYLYRMENQYNIKRCINTSITY